MTAKEFLERCRKNYQATFDVYPDSVDGLFGFVAHIMVAIRATFGWKLSEFYKRSGGRTRIFESALARGETATCGSLSRLLAEVVEEIPLRCRTVLFYLEDGTVRHGGLEVELGPSTWCYYDTSFRFCAKDQSGNPLSTEGLKNNKHLIELWDRSFSQMRALPPDAPLAWIFSLRHKVLEVRTLESANPQKRDTQ